MITLVSKINEITKNITGSNLESRLEKRLTGMFRDFK